MRFAVIVLSALLAVPPVLAAQPPSGASGQAAVNPARQFVRNAPLPRWVQPLADIPATKRTDPVVVRLVETQALVGAVPAVLLNRAIQVNDRSSLGEIGQFSISFFPVYQKLLLHRVAILRGAEVLERTEKVNTRVLDQEANLASGVYGGAATLQLLLDDVRIGDTLWLTYTIEGENPVFGRRWSSDFSWDTGRPIELRRLTVLHPKSRPVRWRQLGDYRKEPIEPRLDSAGGLERIRFEGRAIEPLEFEPSIPSHHFPARMLQFSEYSDWQEVAAWADGLFPRVIPGAGLKAIAKEFAKEPTPEAKASAALHWVQSQIRYFSVSIGENSHRPQTPDTVIKRRYGDCKDVSYLLISLLAELGIEARPVLLSAKSPAIIAKLAPTPGWFDHAIVQVTIDGRDYYVDPTRTGQTASIGKLPILFAGASVLVVDPKTRGLTTLPERAFSAPQYEHNEKIVISAFDGDATLETTRVYRDTYAEWARLVFPLMSGGELGKNALAGYEKQYAGVALAETPRFKDDPAANVFEITARYRLPKPVTHKDKAYSIKFESEILKGTIGVPDKLVRNHPFSLSTGKYRARYRLVLDWPTSVRRNDAPTAKEIDNKFFTVGEQFTMRGNRLDYQLDYRIKVNEVGAAELPALQAETERVDEFTSGSFRIPDSAVVDEAIRPYSYRDLDRLIAAGHVFNATKGMEKRADKDLPVDVICTIARHTAHVDEPGNGLALERSLRAGLGREGIKPCLGEWLFAHGKFEDSIVHFNGVPLVDSSEHVRDLAWARFYSGDNAGALRDMARFIAARSKAGGDTQPFDRVSFLALLQRTRQPIPADLAEYAAADPGGPWPRPLLAMQAGAISEDALLKLARNYPSDARAVALSEAWFYIGQRRLAANDTDGALAAFRWLMVDGIRSSKEYLQARALLARAQAGDGNYREAVAAFARKDVPAALARLRASAQAGVAVGQRELGIAFYHGHGLAKDHTQALHWFRQAAAQKDPVASNFLGIMYALGEGVPVDDVEATRWYEIAAGLGNPNAQYNLGTRYRWGNTVKQDHAKAFEYVRQAAEQGEEDAQAELSLMYSSGRGVAVDATLAVVWAERSSAQGNPEGQMQLGYLLQKGLGIDKDVDGARALYLRAAGQGHAVAQYNLGSMYDRGVGVPENEAEAFKWFEKSAKGNDVDAQLVVARRLAEGRGVRANLALARTWFEAAAANGSLPAMYELGMMYGSGKDVPKDLAKAFALFKQSAEGGEASAQTQVGFFYRNGYGTEKNPAQAVHWYRKAMESGSMTAANSLAEMYAHGLGVERDGATALSLHRQAARDGLASAFLSLAALYESGTGVKRDPVQAYVYYRIGGRMGENDSPETKKKREMAARGLSPDELEKANGIADNWKIGVELPGEQSVVETFTEALSRFGLQGTSGALEQYDQTWDAFNNRLGLDERFGCYAKPGGPVQLVLLIDEAGLVRHVAADRDDSRAKCFRESYMNVRFPPPPVTPYRTKLLMQ